MFEAVLVGGLQAKMVSCKSHFYGLGEESLKSDHKLKILRAATRDDP